MQEPVYFIKTNTTQDKEKPIKEIYIGQSS
jgi:hypothetical protein